MSNLVSPAIDYVAKTPEGNLHALSILRLADLVFTAQ